MYDSSHASETPEESVQPTAAMPYLRRQPALVGLPRVALHHLLPGAPGAASKQRGTARGWVSHSPASKSYDSWGFLERGLRLEQA